MKFEVRFADNNGHISTSGMNNLIIIDDKRIKTYFGLERHITDIVKKYHPAKIGKMYSVYNWLSDESVYEGVVK